jgi:hypothetical protein
MSPDPFFQPGALGAAGRACPIGCPCGGPKGFCSACIHPDCLRISADGAVRVGLSAGPEDWFGMVSALGPVLHLARNEVAVLGQIAPMPRLCDWRNPVLPRDAIGSFAPNLAEYASLRAVREPSPAGTAYGFESRDVSGRAFERIVLTAPANRDGFERFVIEHQSPPEDAVTWFSPNHVAGASRRRIITGRVSILRATHLRRLPPEVLLEVLSKVIEREVLFRTVHYTPALIRATTWTPRWRESSGGPGDVELFSDDQTGLHVFPAAISGVWLRPVRCDCCAREQWTLEVADPHEHLALVLAVGAVRQEAAWREVCREVMRDRCGLVAPES